MSDDGILWLLNYVVTNCFRLWIQRWKQPYNFEKIHGYHAMMFQTFSLSDCSNICLVTAFVSSMVTLLASLKHNLLCLRHISLFNNSHLSLGVGSFNCETKCKALTNNQLSTLPNTCDNYSDDPSGKLFKCEPCNFKFEWCSNGQLYALVNDGSHGFSYL